ncbi:Hydroxymethylpyrimidine kinase [Lentibacillus sp. JNUCC-1]|uniref:bifunctional hydroxymethylpyrimidine kinase/phosphomethylpyrimidine kinase n=1 Tax=Lentibacillus sp. JNUCC-1 TaxID=2654513 RepID=UPI0012E8644A|nr:bifunctional hydroxymethylpyrimidine kinase/phosphomethylpyrimidine kinase [Lentibacillus sp. JNUCC-1]MUV36748.1 Hydroxymethylpyrimidine kinase [Lentibacillus sp. JNUCC-1]
MNDLTCVLTIAGTDPSGGAGIHADLKTFQELKTYGMSVITTLVSQNTTGVQATHDIPLDFLKQQFDSILDDIPVHAFKTGMLENREIMQVFQDKMRHVDAPYIMDPVMVTTSGHPLIHEDAQEFLREELLPLATVVTPNVPEAEVLTGKNITTTDDMRKAAYELVHDYGAGAALVKGGHLKGEALDVLYDGLDFNVFSNPRINTDNTHGTGCTLSAAITAYMGQGIPLIEAVEKAKHYITAALTHSLDIGKGSGPTNHWAPRMKED